MKKTLTVFGLLSLISCFSESDKYEIINDFLKDKNIRLENLSVEPYYFKNAVIYFKENEFKEQGFDIKSETKYTIDTTLIPYKTTDEKSICITKISKPLLSLDGKKSLIAIEKYCGSDMQLVIYLLYLENDKWIVKTNIKAEKEFSH